MRLESHIRQADYVKYFFTNFWVINDATYKNGEGGRSSFSCEVAIFVFITFITFITFGGRAEEDWSEVM